MKSIAKIWSGCSKSEDKFHWAFYLFQDEDDEKYWCDEHLDKKNKCYYRHQDFMSIPCAACGAYSPLRAGTQFLSPGDESCKKEQIINYRSNEDLSDNLAYYQENGWFYIYFKETLSDSLFGQETFRLKHLPNDPIL